MKIEKQINLELTQTSGQTSQPPWFKTEKQEYLDIIKINNTPILIKLSQKNLNTLNIEYETQSNTEISDKKIENEIKRIYDLNFNLEKFYNTLDTEFNLPEAIEFCNGLRLFLAKDPFEAVISSISSSNNSIKRWTNSIDTIKYKWGESHQFPSGKFYTFPKPETLLNIFKDDTEEHEYTNKKIENCTNNLKACGVGYRDKYIQETSKILTENLNYKEIFKMTYEEAYEEIIKLPGAGPKVTDCILLYGFGFREAFPSDVWIKRIISYLYFNQKEISAKKAREYGINKFGEYAGYTQLYLFHYARKSGLMDKIKK